MYCLFRRLGIIAVRCLRRICREQSRVSCAFRSGAALISDSARAIRSLCCRLLDSP